MKKHFVTFMSPGTFVSETTTKEVQHWGIEKAVKMADSIKERHGATPYGFYFTTRERKANEFDSKQINRSPTHYLGGKILTLQEVENRNNPDDKILISNMRNNGFDKVIENTNSWKVVQPLHKDDIVLEYEVPQ